jgi:hypothetical protein
MRNAMNVIGFCLHRCPIAGTIDVATGLSTTSAAGARVIDQVETKHCIHSVHEWCISA